MGSEVLKKAKKKNKKGKSANVITFDEEIVPKHVAEELLAKEHEQSNENVKKESKKKNKQSSVIEDEIINKNEESVTQLIEDININKKNKKKKRKHLSSSEETDATNYNNTEENVSEESKKKKKRKMTNQEPEETSDPSNPTEPKKTESIREMKRKKYAKLLEEKKIKSELALQQKALNYLSKWKHSRQEWKFEKLRQIWLQQNMYDEAKMPEEFWETSVEYFSNSRGKAREVILKEALKTIEDSGENSEDTLKIKRARDMIQCLQE